MSNRARTTDAKEQNSVAFELCMETSARSLTSRNLRGAFEPRSLQKKPRLRERGFLVATGYVTPRGSIMLDRQSSSSPRNALPAEASADTSYLRGNHVGSNLVSGPLKIERRSPASRQEGATAEKAVPFSKFRRSILINIQERFDDDVDLPVRDRCDDFLLPLCRGDHDER